MAKPEALNSGAISVINRVSAKLTGRDFRPSSNRIKSSTVTASSSASASATATATATAATLSFPDLFSPSIAATAAINNSNNNAVDAAPKQQSTVPPVEWPLSVQAQVDRLIGEATRIENLCQAYVGW